MTSQLPSSWTVVRFGDITRDIRYGVNEKNGEDGSGPRLLRISDVTDNGELVRRTPTRLELQSSELDRYRLEYGDLLLARSGSVGRSFVVTDSFEDWVFASYFIRFRLNTSIVHPEYAGLFCRSSFFKGQVERIARVVAQPNVNSGEFASMRFPLPPLSEQQRIVDILQEAEKVRRLRALAAAKTAELIPALFATVFGDLYTGKSPFPICLLSELGELDRGRSRHRPRDEPSLFDGPYPFLQTGDIAQSNGWVTSYTQTYSEKGLEQSRLWPKGTLAITIAANIGSTAILGFDACFPDSVVGFTPKKGVSAEYVRWWLTGYQKKLEIQAPQGAQKNINLEVLRAIRIPVPPIEVQQKFDAALENLRDQIGANKKADDAFRLLSSSLSAHAFTGQLTEEWRAARPKLLAKEARKRDDALAIAAGKEVLINFSLADPDEEREFFNPPSGISRDQLRLWLAMMELNLKKKLPRYFTAEHLAEQMKEPLHRHPQAIESHLTVFAVRGIVIPVSRARDAVPGKPFAASYRLPMNEEGAAPEQRDDVKAERMKHQRSRAAGKR